MTRQRWTSNSTFVMAAVGSAVGLGNVWRFPYLAGKYGGGAFLVPYLIALFVVGAPLLMLEIAVGQKMQQGAIGSFRKLHPSFGGLGLFTSFSAFVVVSYYAVVMAWCLIYFLASFTGAQWSGDSQSYFFQQVLQISDSVANLGGINGPIFLALLAIWVSIYFCVWQGTKSVEKVILYSVPLPVILLAVLLLRAVTLPGFLDGWRLYLNPVWPALLDPAVWSSAFSQIFFSFSLAFGTMIAYGSYKSNREDVSQSAWKTAWIDVGISLFAGFVVFAVLGYMAGQTKTPIEELAASGPGLAFVVFPKALSLMPLPWLFSALFFLTLLSLGIDSAFSLVETVNAVILDRHERATIAKVSLWVCVAGFCAGIIYTTRAGLYFLDIADHFVTNYNSMLVGILESVLVGWVYGAQKLRRYINEVSNWHVGQWWNISIKYIIPPVLAALLAAQFSTDFRTPYEGYPAFALSLGWTLPLCPLLLFLGLWMRDRKAQRNPL